MRASNLVARGWHSGSSTGTASAKLRVCRSAHQWPLEVQSTLQGGWRLGSSNCTSGKCTRGSAHQWALGWLKQAVPLSRVNTLVFLRKLHPRCNVDGIQAAAIAHWGAWLAQADSAT
eukprot:78191-Pelagomonas_calceolata.AAC.3